MGHCTMCCVEKKHSNSTSCLEQNPFNMILSKSNKVLPFQFNAAEETLPTEHDIE